MKKVLGCIKRADNDFKMIDDGDILGVGLSGGKDSMVLLYALHLYKNFCPSNFKLKAITIDMGFEGFDIEKITKFCDSLGIEHVIERTKMGQVIFEERKEKNPCAFCSKMRRGLLNKLCTKNSITKLVLGHHGDDAIETMLMSMIYESRVHTFKPVTYFERAEIFMIRPMIYAFEKDIKEALLRHDIPIVKNPCPASGETKRQYTKDLINKIEVDVNGSRKNILEAIWNSNNY